MSCTDNTFMHKHHIIPRYKGGSDAPENLVEVTVVQHAMYHFCNYQLWGNVEDYVAWRGLSGQTDADKFKKEKFASFGKKGGLSLKKKLENDEYYNQYVNDCKKRYENEEYRNKIVSHILSQQPRAIILARTPEAIEKKRKKYKKIEHQQGEKNSQYGKIWITNGTKEGTYKINKEHPIPEGYRRGRICFNEKDLNKIYVITTPFGEIIKTKYLLNFCVEHDLKYSIMSRISKNKNRMHKGYKVFIEEDLTPRQ